ncbi:MAG: hypothetical protein KDA28_15755, partial [Phycisphaerales bacterium]|nr:hypothetical protein [Phycisphaerales bacterium]
MNHAPRALASEGMRVAHFVYDDATGRVRRVQQAPKGFRVQRSGVTSELCFDNLDPNLFMSSHPATHQELVDWGVKSCGMRGRVTSFTFMYRTSLPSVDLSVAFYMGTTGFGNLGTQIRRFGFQGLPAGVEDIQPGIPPGQYLNTMTVDLSANPMCLPDGPIGWGVTNDDLDSGTFLNHAPNASLGTLDALDVYDAPPAKTGVYTGTYNFASQGVQVASITIQLEEEDGAGLAGVNLLNGNGSNPIAFTPIGFPLLGESWSANLDYGVAPGTTQNSMVISLTPAIFPSNTIAGQLLVDLSDPLLIVTTDKAFHRINIPKDNSLSDLTVYAQTLFFLGGPLTFTNGLAL